jgi:hypothetical protein
MLTGQLIVYRFNGLHNAKKGIDRNHYRVEDINVTTPEEFKHRIRDALDEVPSGRGYVLVRYKNKTYIAENDPNNPKSDYIRHEITYHPLLEKFTI